MTILQAQTDLANIAQALDQENELAAAAHMELIQAIEAVRFNMNMALDNLKDALAESVSARENALLVLIGAPVPVEFKQAAE